MKEFPISPIGLFFHIAVHSFPPLTFPAHSLSTSECGIPAVSFSFLACCSIIPTLDLDHVGPGSTGLGLPSSAGLNKEFMTQRSRDGLWSHWLAFCLQANCALSAFHMYAISHEGDWPRECEWHHGKPGCPTSRKAKPTVASLWMGGLPCCWGYF